MTGSPQGQTEEIERPWLPLAALALQASIDGDMPSAGRLVQEIADTYGAQAIPFVMLAFVDTTCMQVFGRYDAPGGVELAWMHEGTREIHGADEVPPSIRWAGRFAAARFANDEPAAKALVNSVRDDQEWTDNVAALLHICGSTIRSFGRPRQAGDPT